MPVELTIVMPCLNEAETLAACIEKAGRFLIEAKVDGEIVIGDNGSTDGSQAIALGQDARLVNVPLHGYGAALFAACREARGRYIIMGDSDDSYDFSRLGPFLERLRAGDDLVMGNRFAGEIKPGAMPWKNRYIGNPVLSGLGQLLFSTQVRDFHCGLRGFSRAAFDRMELRTLGMEFASEMVIKATLLRMRVSEVPTVLWPDGRSRPPHLRPWRDGWRHLRFMLLFSPNWLFFYPGLVILALGLVMVGLLSYRSLTFGGVTLDVDTLIYCAFASTIGFQAVLFSFLSRRYAVQNHLYPETESFLKASSWFTLERGLLLGFLVAGAGLIGAVCSLWDWNQQHFGNLNLGVVSRLVIPSALAMSLGIETILFSFSRVVSRWGSMPSSSQRPAEAGLTGFMSDPLSARGFIIGRMPFGNTSLIVRCLCAQAGRLTLLAKGVGRPKSPFAGSLDLFYLADFLYQPSRSGNMHTLREVRLVEAHLGLRRSYANLLAAQYFAALIETVTETGTPVPAEYELFGKALGYLTEVEVSWRAVERFEQRILALAGIAQAGHDLPRAFHALHHKVPSLREDLLKQLASAKTSR